MAVKFAIATFALAFCCAAEPVKGEDFYLKRETPSGSCFGFELLITQLEILEQKLGKLDNLEQKLTKLDILEQKLSKLDTVEQKLSKVDHTLEKQVKNVFQSCSEVQSKISGKYRLRPDSNKQSFVGFCEQEKFGGGWLVIQHRFDGSVDFYRNWTDYKNGFGEIGGEFWIGLERLHKLTKDKNVTLMVEIEDFDGNYGYARYDEFEIGDEDAKYVLKRISGYSGTIGDSMMSTDKGCMFTTRDSDNDRYSSRNCAEISNGAWWYNFCSRTNPNGPYHKKAEWPNFSGVTTEAELR
nr:fibroleukin-like isoform X2 [Aedes albopictus]